MRLRPVRGAGGQKRTVAYGHVLYYPWSLKVLEDEKALQIIDDFCLLSGARTVCTSVV